MVEFMHAGTSDDPLKDEILRPLFQSIKEEKEHRYRTVLLVIFWPGLNSIHRQMRHKDSDFDALWQNIIWSFYEVICGVDVEKRPCRLVQKIFNSTFSHLRRGYRREWEKGNREMSLYGKDGELLEKPVENISFGIIDLLDAKKVEIRQLQLHMEEGRINEADFLLLVGRKVYKQSLADYARKSGIKYETAKKRYQRAEATIRNFEKNLQNHVPKKTSTPPFTYGGEERRWNLSWDKGGRKDDLQNGSKGNHKRLV